MEVFADDKSSTSSMSEETVMISSSTSRYVMRKGLGRLKWAWSVDCSEENVNGLGSGRRRVMRPRVALSVFGDDIWDRR